MTWRSNGAEAPETFMDESKRATITAAGVLERLSTLSLNGPHIVVPLSPASLAWPSTIPRRCCQTWPIVLRRLPVRQSVSQSPFL